MFLNPLDPGVIGNLISGFSAFSKSSLNTWKFSFFFYYFLFVCLFLTWKFSVHLLLKPSLENFEHYFASDIKKLLYMCHNWKEFHL